jgi:hypothetical protein
MGTTTNPFCYNFVVKHSPTPTQKITVVFVFADFSDVVTFNTTYGTNRYSMPLAMFVGCNNHLQNVVFAQALCWGLVLKCYELRTRQHKKC